MSLSYFSIILNVKNFFKFNTVWPIGWNCLKFSISRWPLQGLFDSMTLFFLWSYRSQPTSTYKKLINKQKNKKQTLAFMYRFTAKRNHVFVLLSSLNFSMFSMFLLFFVISKCSKCSSCHSLQFLKPQTINFGSFVYIHFWN